MLQKNIWVMPPLRSRYISRPAISNVVGVREVRAGPPVICTDEITLWCRV